MNSLVRIHRLLDAANSEDRNFPATMLFNEGWLLRIIVDWFSRNSHTSAKLRFLPESKWYSEALLESPFLRGALREGFTHADAVVGQFKLRPKRGDVELLTVASQFVVIEAKMGSALSTGTRHAPDYNQAARNVACMAKVIERAGAARETLSDCRFLVLAPESKIHEHDMDFTLSADQLCAAIRRRSLARGEEDQRWVERWVVPLLVERRLRAAAISWESIIEEIVEKDLHEGESIRQFYRACKLHNRLGEQTVKWKLPSPPNIAMSDV